jgi:hypothetical protein
MTCVNPGTRGTGFVGKKYNLRDSKKKNEECSTHGTNEKCMKIMKG